MSNEATRSDDVRFTRSVERQRIEGFGRLDLGLHQASDWYLWGPYLSERQWGTVREDYSPDGDAWNYLPHDHARSRAYRWGEDGLAGFCDIEQRLCLALALWNGHDPILKERCFGLTGAEANHGEDVKEYWWYLDAVPSHAWNSWRYHYPQRAFPYQQLLDENRRHSKHDHEYELLDTGIFDDDRYWVVDVHYADMEGRLSSGHVELALISLQGRIFPAFPVAAVRGRRPASRGHGWGRKAPPREGLGLDGGEDDVIVLRAMGKQGLGRTVGGSRSRSACRFATRGRG